MNKQLLSYDIMNFSHNRNGVKLPIFISDKLVPCTLVYKNDENEKFSKFGPN